MADSEQPNLVEFHALDENEELRRALNQAQRQLRKAKAKTDALVQAAHQGAREAALALGNPPPVPAPRKDRRKGHPEVAILHLSDWQLGKKTDTYNTGVALERIRRIGEKAARLVEIERAGHPVREIHLLLGGDFPEGTTIFPGQPYEIDSTLFEQTFACVGAIEQLARFLLSIFEKVVMWEVDGNHGRLGRKGDAPREDNADLFTYREARARLAEHEKAGRLVWHPRERFFQIVEIGNYRALLVHGDQVKSFGGNIPAFGISRKVNGWATGVLPPFTDVYMGHFHQPLVIPIANGKGRTFVNPSLESSSAYAAEFIAATGTPGQRFHLIDPRHGRITSERILWADED